MGADPEARMAYGYDLGTVEDFKAAERGEYGSPALPWFDEDDEDGFEDKAEKLLLTSVGFTETWSRENTGFHAREREAKARLGVEFDRCGTYEYPGWVLIASGSARSVEWAQTMTVNPAEIGAPRPEWDEKLASALKALGITPTQDGPKWLAYPFYG